MTFTESRQNANINDRVKKGGENINFEFPFANSIAKLICLYDGYYVGLRSFIFTKAYS